MLPVTATLHYYKRVSSNKNKKYYMKFLLSITMLAASVFTTANAAPVKQAQVHNLLTLYESFYSRVYEGSYTSTEYIAGNKTYMIQNMEYAHAIELIQAIKNGAFDKCCWKPYAKGYGQYWNATTDTIIANPAMTLMNNENAPYNVPTDYSLLITKQP